MDVKVLAALFALVSLVSNFAPADAFSQAQPAGQPSDEVAAQSQLPRISDPLWTKLSKCGVGYNEENGIYSLKITPEVKALDGKTVTLRGFILPMDGSDRSSHFLITRNTPVCLYCPPGGPNEVVEVNSATPIAWTRAVVEVEGKLNVINNGEQGLFFEIQATRVKK